MENTQVFNKITEIQNWQESTVKSMFNSKKSSLTEPVNETVLVRWDEYR